jgi:hypothetical protein
VWVRVCEGARRHQALPFDLGGLGAAGVRLPRQRGRDRPISGRGELVGRAPWRSPPVDRIHGLPGGWLPDPGPPPQQRHRLDLHGHRTADDGRGADRELRPVRLRPSRVAAQPTGRGLGAQLYLGPARRPCLGVPAAVVPHRPLVVAPLAPGDLAGGWPYCGVDGAGYAPPVAVCVG